MKKVVVLSAVALTIGLTAPQFAGAKDVQTQPAVEVVNQEIVYELIDSSELPSAVQESIASDYSVFTIDEAYKGDDGSYKVVVKNEDTQFKLFYTAAGELIKVEKP